MHAFDPTAQWGIVHAADDAAAYATLAIDRVWNGYSLCDLEPPLRTYAQITLAQRRAAPPTAACLILRHPAFTALIPHGDPAGVRAIFAALNDLPETPFVLVQDAHLPSLAIWYDIPQRLEMMRRMIVERAAFRPPDTTQLRATRLDLHDLSALQALYALYPSSAFNVDQLRHGVFYGIRSGAALVAAAGTHALAPQAGIAAVGNIFVRPEQRGRGLGRIVTAAVVNELVAGPYREVILNVAVSNAAAYRVYTNLGFREHCRYAEGCVVRKPAPNRRQIDETDPART